MAINESAVFEEKNQELRDEDILLASRQEPAIFEVLMDRYQQPLFRAAFRVLRSKEEAEDVVQEAFLKMYRNSDKFAKLDGIEFKSWAYKVTINTAITHYRKLKKGPLLVEDVSQLSEEPVAAGDDHIALMADVQATVGNTLERMPSHLRVVLQQYYLHDKPYDEIAKIENITLATVKMRLFRARKLFKKLSGGFEL